MGSKTLSPLCSSQDVEGCVVDNEGEAMLLADAGQILKTYDVLTVWE